MEPALAPPACAMSVFAYGKGSQLVKGRKRSTKEVILSSAQRTRIHDALTRQGPVPKGLGDAHRPALSGLAGGEDSSARRRLAPTRRFWFVSWAPWSALSGIPTPGASACDRASISCSLPHTCVAHLRGRRTCQQTRMLCLSCLIDRARGAAVQFSKVRREHHLADGGPLECEEAGRARRHFDVVSPFLPCKANTRKTSRAASIRYPAYRSLQPPRSACTSAYSIASAATSRIPG